MCRRLLHIYGLGARAARRLRRATGGPEKALKGPRGAQEGPPGYATAVAHLQIGSAGTPGGEEIEESEEGEGVEGGK